MAFNDLLSAFATTKTPIKPPTTAVPVAPTTTKTATTPIAPLPSYMTSGLYSTSTKTTTPSNVPTTSTVKPINPSAPLTITMPATPSVTPTTTMSSTTSAPKAPAPITSPTAPFSSGASSSSGTSGYVTSPNGAVFDPASGRIIKAGTSIGGYDSGSSPTIPTVPTAPASSPAPTNPTGLTELEKAYQANLELSPEEMAAQAERDRLQESFRKGYQNIEDQAIPMEFIVGQQQSLEKRALNLAEPLEATMARLQAKRQASLEASKFALERADKATDRATQASERAQDRAFDQQKFAEDTRRFGLEYALSQQKMSGAAEGFTLGEGQQRYDAQGNLIASGPDKTGGANGGKIVNVNGVDYWQDAYGNLTTPNVPQGSAQTSAIKSDALKSAQDLLTKLQAGTGTSAVGGSRLFGLQYLPGTDPKNFEIQFNNLKSLLSLDNVKLLKGQGAVSDAERQLLANASSKLDLAQSEEEFKTALQDIIKGLDGSMSGDPQAVRSAYDRLNTGTSYEQAVATYGEDGVRRILQSQGISFNSPPSTGLKGSGQLPNIAVKYPTNSTGGQCVTWLHEIAKFPYIGNGKLEKFASVRKLGLTADKWRSQAKVGDIVIFDEDNSYGHGAMINEIVPGWMRLSESNYKGDDKVSHSRWVRINDPKIYGAIRPTSFKV